MSPCVPHTSYRKTPSGVQAVASREDRMELVPLTPLVCPLVPPVSGVPRNSHWSLSFPRADTRKAWSRPAQGEEMPWGPRGSGGQEGGHASPPHGWLRGPLDTSFAPLSHLPPDPLLTSKRGHQEWLGAWAVDFVWSPPRLPGPSHSRSLRC